MAYASSPKLRMETFEVDSCIQRYHVFESTGEELNCVRERTNTEDPYEALSCPPKDVSRLCAILETKGDHPT